MSDRDWKTDTKIDPMKLDVEWVQQSHLVAVYSQDLAEQRGYIDTLEVELATLEENRKTMRGTLQLDIRDDPEKYGLEKITEATVDAALRTASEWIELNDEILEVRSKLADANLKASRLYGILKALDHKKDALENLVKLLGQDYFSGPSVPHKMDSDRCGAAKYVSDDSADDGDAEIAQKMNKGKKKKSRRRKS